MSPTGILETVAKQSVAFWFVCLYVFFEYVRPQSIYPWLDAIPWAQTILISAFLLSAAESASRKRPVYGSQFPLLLAFLGLAAASLAISDFPQDGLERLTILCSWLMAIFVITRTATSESRVYVMFLLFYLCNLKMVQHGFVTWAGRGFTFDRDGVYGAPGWFHNSGEFGIQMCFFLPVAIHFAIAVWSSVGNFARTILTVTPVFTVGAIIASSSRGAVLGALAACAWMVLSANKRRVRLAFLLALATLTAFLLVPDEFIQRFQTMGEDGNSIRRLEYWKFGWDLAKAHPIFGVGPANWTPVYAQYLTTIGETRAPQVPHNIFVEAMAETGFVGLLLVVLLCVAIFRINFSSIVVAKKKGVRFLAHCAYGLNAGTFGFLVSAQFVTVLYYPYLWIALALAIAVHNVAVGSGKPNHTQHRVAADRVLPEQSENL